MAIVPRMREQLREAMKAREAVRTNFLRYWIAQLTLGTGEEMPDDQAVKKMRGILKEAQSGRVAFSPEELDLIREWVPPTLSRRRSRRRWPRSPTRSKRPRRRARRWASP